MAATAGAAHEMSLPHFMDDVVYRRVREEPSALAAAVLAAKAGPQRLMVGSRSSRRPRPAAHAWLSRAAACARRTS
jgi:hypothetical protein